MTLVGNDVLEVALSIIVQPMDFGKSSEQRDMNALSAVRGSMKGNRVTWHLPCGPLTFFIVPAYIS
jgi:hypothetical protein